MLPAINQLLNFAEMLLRSMFSEQQQFHLLVRMRGADRSITVLPGTDRKFLIIDQGQIIGELIFDRWFTCIANYTKLSLKVLRQLKAGISNHCKSYPALR